VKHAPATALALAACWTGSTAPTPPVPSRDLEVTLDRRACDVDVKPAGCAVYSVTITGEGVVLWHGIENVAAIGERRDRVSMDKLDKLADAIDRARFFERDENGIMLDEDRDVFCAILPGASHEIVIVRHRGMVHRIDMVCPPEPLAALAALIDRIARTARWIR
jgi:hypothetical protein